MEPGGGGEKPADMNPNKTDKTPLLVNEDASPSDEAHRLRQYSTSEVGDQDSSDGSLSGGVTATTTARRTPCFVYLLTFFSAIGGFLFGYDTGVISGAMLLVRGTFHMTDLQVELVVSITIGAAAVCAVVSGFLNDKIGRKPTTLLASTVFSVGSVVLAAANSMTMLYIGRFIVGMGIGFASSTVPMYIAENAPPEMRGRLVTLNNVFITGGQFVASVVDGLFSRDKVNGWRYMLGIAALPAAIQFVGFIFMPESPRWLIMKGKETKARGVLQQIRGHPNIEAELDHIKSIRDEDRREREERGDRWVVMDMMTTGHVRKALILGCLLQAVQQLAGINTVMYYSATIIKMSGVKTIEMATWLAAVTSFSNFIFTFVGLWLVERVGRRPLTLASLAGVTFSLLFLAGGFQLAAYNSPHISQTNPLAGNSTSCNTYRSCDPCMVDSDCGFCYEDTSSGPVNGTCLPVSRLDGHAYTDMSGVGRCNNTHLADGLTWAYEYCPTDYSWMAMVGMVIYLACFAPGMGPMPWTLNSEIYPLWARSTGNSITTTVNWVFNLAISMSFLTLTTSLTRYGAFYLYAALALVGLILLWWLLPETKGKKLEDIEEVFRRPWFGPYKKRTSADGHVTFE